MTRLLLDTNAYSQAMRGNATAMSLLRSADQLLVCPVVPGELLAGFRRGAREQENREQLNRFLARPRVILMSIGADTAEFYSHVLSQLRRSGTPIPVNDIWIAACTMEHGASLATRDRHFQEVEGLLTISY